MRQARRMRGGLAVLVAAWVGSAGCIQNYYPATVCNPSGAPMGSVCEVPPVVNGAIGQSPARTTVVGGAPPRVVVSQPNSGLSWRRSDPDSLTTTRVEGAIDEPTLQR